jgi:hypothetical protein
MLGAQLLMTVIIKDDIFYREIILLKVYNRLFYIHIIWSFDNILGL